MVTTTDQGLSYIQYEADGVAVNFMLTFPYLSQDHIHVFLDGVETFDFTWLNSSEITMDVAPANLALLTIKRNTKQDERIVDFQDGGVIREATLDLDSNQLFYLTQEAIDTTNFNLAIDSTTSVIDAQNNRIINVADGIDPQDAVTMAQLDEASGDAAALAAAAQATANAAVVTANNAAIDAAAAVVTANAIAATANAALIAANAAVVTADNAEDVANGIAATANQAAVDAAAAVVTANAAAADATQALADALAAQIDATAALADNAQAGISNALGTGVVTFAGLGINVNPTKFDVGAMDAWFVDNTTTPLTPTRTRVSLPSQTAIIVTNLLTHLVTYVGQNQAGVIIQSTSPFTPTQRRTIASLGVVVHSDHINVNAVNNAPSISIDGGAQLDDLMESIGSFNISGNIISANGANLSINKTVGVMFKKGVGFESDTKNPHSKTLALLTAPSIRYRLQDSTEYASTTLLDPTMYDNAGVLTLIPAATRWSIQRISVFQSNLIRIQYGQAHYANSADALAAIGTEVFATEQNIRENGLLRGYLVVRRNATALNNLTTAIFVEAPRFSGIASGTGIVATLQTAYSNSTSPEILTDSVLGAVTMKRGSAADTDNVLEIENGAGTLVASITGEGNSVLMGVKNPRVLEAKRDTYANLVTYAALGSSVNGQFVFATDILKMYQIIANTLAPVGGSSGGLSTMFQLIAEEQITDWTTGDNATFLGAGAISGTFAKNTATPIQGLASYKYTQAAGSLNDYMASAPQALDLRFRGRECTFSMSNKYDGALGDIEVIFYDATNAAIIPSSVFVPANTSLNRFATNIFVPATCLSIRVGFHTKVLNSGKIFEFDSIEFGLDTTVFASLNNDTEWSDSGYSTTDFTGLGTVTVITLQSKRDGSDLLIRGKFTAGTTTAVEARLNLRHAGSLVTSAGTPSIGSLQVAGTAVISTTGAASYYTLIEPSVGYMTFSAQAASNSGQTKLIGTNLMSSTNQLTIEARIPIAGWSEKSSNILTVPDTFSTDTAPLVYAGSAAYTLATLNTAPVGTFITYTYAINTNTRTQTTTAPTQTIADMSANGILITARTYNAASVSTVPATFAIQIGKGLKGLSVAPYKATGKVNAGNIDRVIYNTTTESGFNDKAYNELTGVLVIDAGGDMLTTNTSHSITFSDQTSQASGYVVINASKNPALTGLNINAVYVRGAGNAGNVITANVTDITFTEILDSHGAWNGTQFTVPETGNYSITASAYFTTAAAGGLEVFVGGTLYKYIGDTVTQPYHTGAITDYFTKGQVISIRSTRSATLLNDVNGSWISIAKTNVG